MTDLVVLSLGAGVQSSTLALMAARGDIGPMPDCAIFADTGNEPDGTYKYLEYLEPLLPFPVHRVSVGNIKVDCSNGVNSSGLRFVSLPFFIKKQDGTRGIGRRQCTNEYKIKPIRKKIRELLGLEFRKHAAGKFTIEQWIGISTDEKQRMTDAVDKWIINRWPLIETGLSRYQCVKWLEDRQYKIPPKSACKICPFTDNARWREIKINDPAAFNEAVAFDRMLRLAPGKFDGELFLHSSLMPLGTVDFRNLEDMGQLSFLDECLGMCGV